MLTATDGAKVAPKVTPTGVTHVKNGVRIVPTIFTTGVHHGASVAQNTALVTVRIAMNTMRVVAIVALAAE
jgi:hypothetical protein